MSDAIERTFVQFWCCKKNKKLYYPAGKLDCGVMVNLMTGRSTGTNKNRQIVLHNEYTY